MRIAYAGAPGAFAHEACLAFAAEWEPAAMGSFADVADAVEAGEAVRGMLPLRNSKAGPVEEVEALLAERRLTIVSEHRLTVRMHLLARPGIGLDAIEVVASHPMALRQCAGSLAKRGLATEAAANTAIAARDLTSGRRAVLASQAAAEAYGLHILLRDLQDDPDNATVFALVRAR